MIRRKKELYIGILVMFLVGLMVMPRSAFAETQPKGKCSMTIYSDKNDFYHQAQADGPCAGLVTGQYQASQDMFSIQGAVSFIVTKSGQQFVVATPAYKYFQSVLTVNIVKVKPTTNTSSKTDSTKKSSDPTTSKSTTSKPTTSKPTTSKTATSKTTTSKTTTSKPTTSKTTTSKPTTSKPTTSKKNSNASSKSQSNKNQESNKKKTEKLNKSKQKSSEKEKVTVGKMVAIYSENAKVLSHLNHDLVRDAFTGIISSGNADGLDGNLTSAQINDFLTLLNTDKAQKLDGINSIKEQFKDLKPKLSGEELQTKVKVKKDKSTQAVNGNEKKSQDKSKSFLGKTLHAVKNVFVSIVNFFSHLF